jgi:hypothetical protein
LKVKNKAEARGQKPEDRGQKVHRRKKESSFFLYLFLVMIS